jgi:hypothetical protein
LIKRKRRKAPRKRQTGSFSVLAARTGLYSPVLVFANAFFGISAPVQTGRAYDPAVHLPTGFTFCLSLITPDLYLCSAMAAGNIFRLGLFDIFAAWTFVFKHFLTSHLYYAMKHIQCMIWVI